MGIGWLWLNHSQKENLMNKIFKSLTMLAAVTVFVSSCGAPTPTPAIEQPTATQPPTATEIAPTNTLEPAATQVVLGVVEGTIAFVSNRDGNNEIYVMNGDGSGLTNLTDNPADDGGEDYGPVWSPDGKRILFSSSRDGNLEIYMMNADGSDQTNLTNSPADDGEMD
jgi:dipeptidyl aminopeptidase/acylaminoacyl peptidase